TVSTTTYLVNGLSSATDYSFEVQTEDNLTFSTDSNVISFDTPGALTATASASRLLADTGQQVNFSCAGSGGAGGYEYSWAFGDGHDGSGAHVTHVYASTGSMDAVCTVTDS